MGRTESDAPGCAPDEAHFFDPSIDDFVSKARDYIHFDLPLSESQREAFSITPTQIRTRSFWPLLGFNQVERRVKYDSKDQFSIKEKIRPIRFCSHTDAAILEHYARKLGREYESFLGKSNFGSCVLAYRSGLGDNIAQAGSLIEEIKSRRNAIAIAVDVKGFFDHIHHEILLENLKRVLNTDRLSDADFTIFKRMSNFEFVESERLALALGRQGPVRGRICTANEFRRLVKPKGNTLVVTNRACYGIPQGTPLSGLYANISMLGFDSIMDGYARHMGGSYRRYSDDICIVVPSSVSPEWVVSEIIQNLCAVGLRLSPGKTDISEFSGDLDSLNSDKPFQYLGFTFDGRKTLVRQSSLNRYYSKMHAGIRAKVRAAKNKGVPRDQIYMRELISRYTHLGKGRNFPRYVYRASSQLSAPEIRSQIARHMERFKFAVQYYVERAYGSDSSSPSP